jgi:hypothetical protein
MNLLKKGFCYVHFDKEDSSDASDLFHSIKEFNASRVL